MKKILLMPVLLFFSIAASAQSAGDIIEHGIPIKKDGNLFFSYEGKELKYDAAFFLSDMSKRTTNFLTIKDSSIFLVRNSGIRVYVKPLNPLNYSYSADNKIIIDPINEAAASALISVGDILDKVVTSNTSNGAPSYAMVDAYGTTTTVTPECSDIETTRAKLSEIELLLKDDQKAKIAGLFEKLKGVNFTSYSKTISQLKPIETGISDVESHFAAVERKLVDAKGLIDAYSCPNPSAFVAQYIFNNIIKDFTALKDEQRKRLANLTGAFDLVVAARDQAEAGNGYGISWLLPVEPTIPADPGKISIYTIKLRKTGYELNDKQEITTIEPSEVLTRTFRIRSFNRFVPEVSVGAVFTFFKYNTWGTTSDSTGQQYVANPTENTMRNLNIAAMVNFNYYIPGSPLINPFYQLGAGINAGIPTILTGFGIRSNINGLRRFAVAGGIAMTWIKTLDQLQVGSKIAGSDDIEKDLKYEFVWPPKPYICLQYNF